MDFVVGMRVHKSNNHPTEDICDVLAGDYPKTFKFSAWHPQCRCYVTSILCTKEEMIKMQRDILAGKSTSGFRSVNEVRTVPKAFTDWVDANGDRIMRAKALPYFLKDNGKIVDGKWVMGLPKRKLTTLEKAEMRHNARTQSEIDDIKARAKARQETIKKTVSVGENVLSVAKKYEGVDAGAFVISGKRLDNALQSKDIVKIKEEYKELSRKISYLKKELKQISDIVPDTDKWIKQFSLEELKDTKSAVLNRMAREGNDLERLKRFLESEIKWVETHKKYKTWEVARDAYEKQLHTVSYKLSVKSIINDVDDALAYSAKTSSKKYKLLADEMRKLVHEGAGVLEIKIKANELNAEYKKLKARRKNTASVAQSQTIKHESIRDLRKRLGKDMPKTLDNLEDAIAVYETTGRYGKTAKQHKKDIEQLMTRLFDEHDLGMNIEDSILESVLNSWFKNTFEVGTSGGYVGSRSTIGKIETSHKRLVAAHGLFGLSKDLKNGQLLRKEYEKYGNLLDHDILQSMTHNTANQYGNVEVRFKKDKVIATWTAGDSLGERYQPSLVSDPKSCSFDDLYKTPTSANIQTKNLAKFKNDHISLYLELQYHGDLTIDCVESLTFPYDLNESSRSQILTVAKKWKTTGVKVYYIANNVLHEL